MSDLMRAVIDSIWPEGSIWRPTPGGDFDKLLDGSAENWETIRVFLDTLRSVRDPNFTTFLADLENEFGVFNNSSLTETQRREQLIPLVFNRSSSGSIDAMQNALDDAGFSVLVHENSPAVDPAKFLLQNFQMVAAGGNAFAGRPDAFAGNLGGILLVNGDLFKTQKAFTSGAATARAFAGTGFSAGEFTDLIRTPVTYAIPTDPNTWPLVFFVGGVAIRDGTTGELLEIAQASVPAEQEQEFKRIVLRTKPIHSWAALILSFD